MSLLETYGLLDEEIARLPEKYRTPLIQGELMNRRQDEAGTPFGITIDGQSLTDGTVTFRDRDSCRQWRVPSAGAVQALRDLLEGQPIPPAG